MKRNNMVHKSYFLGALVLTMALSSCKDTKKNEAEQAETEETTMETKEPFFKLSLAQWSLNKAIRNDSLDPYTFAEKAKGWGFSGLEYVSALYYKELEAANFSEEAMANFVAKSNAEAAKHGMKNLLIMIDNQGDLAVSDEKERNATVENHKKWVDAAAAMGCHAIRVNLNGETDPEKWKKNSIDGLTKLATYAKDKNINIIVENHGGLSSNGALHAEVMEAVNMDNCGTLPDFG
ncbi:MAG: sugar phosphate isomerase/epimerase family protein, partial [Aurantibacter sp.]